MPWYKGELLTMAKELGYRLLPAFNTTTGIPYARVSYNLNNVKNSCVRTVVGNAYLFKGGRDIKFSRLNRIRPYFIVNYAIMS